MLRSSSRRGQTEPIGALFAVVFFIIGIGIYGIYVTDALNEETDRSVQEPAMEQVKDDVEENGIFRSHDHDELEDLIERESLPYGQNVYVEIRAVKDGEETVVADGYFDTEGESARSEFEDDLEGPPEEATAVERPIAVAISPGIVRGGTILVGVW